MIRIRWSKAAFRLILAAALAAAVLLAADIGLDEPVRRRVERLMNERLTGYSAAIGRADLHVWGGSLDLYGLRVAQNANPEPPVADIERLTASVQWKALLRARVVTDIRIDRPVIRMDLRQVSEEYSDEIPVDERGWQQAVEAIYPFKINELRVRGGELVYVDQDPERPLEMHDVAFRADNIRNVFSPDRTYPSPVTLRARVFDRGSLSLIGDADFMSKPHPGMRALLDIDDVDLSYFSPVLERYGLISHRGTLGLRGEVEWGPVAQTVALDELLIAGTRLDYLYRPAAAPEQQEAVEEIVEAAGDLQNAPDQVIRIREMRIQDSRLSIANPGARPSYDVWWDRIDLAAQNISNQAEDGPATASLTARFMGSGPTRADATFLPASRNPDFRLSVGIENTDMRALNDLFRAHGNFDVVAGLFSFYSEVSIRDGRIAGYVKPLFREVDVYHPAQDRHEGFWHRTWERLVGVASKLLRNKPRKEVAARVDISGQVDDPRASTLQIVFSLARNAFVRAILPGLEREAGNPDAQRRRERRQREKERKTRRGQDQNAASGIILEEIPEAASHRVL